MIPIIYNKGELVGECEFLYETIYSALRIKHGRRTAFFRCKCGTKFEALIENVKYCKSTGCKVCHGNKTRNRLITHGYTINKNRPREYRIWEGMLHRCKAIDKYINVGVCQEWKSFENFFADMGKRPSPKHSIDRIDNDMGYSKGNCRWATSKEQCRNRSSNISISYNGERKIITEWCEYLGVSYHKLYQRIMKYNWDIEKAFQIQ